MPLKINVKSVYLYAAYLAMSVLANYALQGVPLSLALLFSMLLCGGNILLTPALFIVASSVHLDLTLFLIGLFQAAFLSLIVLLYRRQKRKIRLEAVVYLIIALAPFVTLADWNGISDEFLNGYVMRTIASLLVIIFTLFTFKSLYAVMFRLYRCRLQEDELVSICLTFVVLGTGLLRLCQQGFYIGIVFFAVVFFLRLMKSPSAIIAALVVSVPLAINSLSLNHITAFVIISTISLVFCGVSRFMPPFVCLFLGLGYMYLFGIFETTMLLKILYIIVLFSSCFLASLPTDDYLHKLKLRLLVKSELTDTALARSKQRVSRKLFRISEVFREIERAFLALDSTSDDKNAKEKIFSEIKSLHCKNCEKRNVCLQTNVYHGLYKLIESGCIKGKVSIVDLPSDVTVNCGKTYEILSSLNRILVEYRQFYIEAENTRSGRVLLADQAHGIAMVLKDCAVDLHSSRSDFFELSEIIKDNLSSQGISCPELIVDGDDDLSVLATIVGEADLQVVAKVISKCLNGEFILKDMLTYDSLKHSYLFTSPPKLDAVFGVAYAIKDGEKISGDTHSVIRIDEKSFLIVLSDGMGSGEKAHSVSDAAISLIEAYYKADMPKDTVLKTVNKLLSFNRDERFTCIDIAAVDLSTARADFVKIGSPAAVILRENELKVLESSSLPLGILETLKPTVCTEMLEIDDIIIFMSDGISSAFKSPDELYRTLESLAKLNPQNLADQILAVAKSRTDGKCFDDMTVVAARVFKR